MSNIQAYVPEDHRAIQILWRRVVAAHKAKPGTEAGAYGVGYTTGMRDGFAEAYSTVTGIPRQQVGDRARAEARVSGPPHG